MHNRRRFLGLSLAALTMELPSVSEARTIDRAARLMVGFPAGSSPDFVARLLAEHLRDYASTIVVDNRPGAGGRIPLEALKAAERDGSVMVLTPGDQVALFPHVYARLGYDSARDFAPVSTVCTVQFILTVGTTGAAGGEDGGRFRDVVPCKPETRHLRLAGRRYPAALHGRELREGSRTGDDARPV